MANYPITQSNIPYNNQYTLLEVGVALNLDAYGCYFKTQSIEHKRQNINSIINDVHFVGLKTKPYKVNMVQLTYVPGVSAEQEHGLIVLPPNIILQ